MRPAERARVAAGGLAHAARERAHCSMLARGQRSKQAQRRLPASALQHARGLMHGGASTEAGPTRRRGLACASCDGGGACMAAWPGLRILLDGGASRSARWRGTVCAAAARGQRRGRAPPAARASAEAREQTSSASELPWRRRPAREQSYCTAAREGGGADETSDGVGQAWPAQPRHARVGRAQAGAAGGRARRG